MSQNSDHNRAHDSGDRHPQAQDQILTNLLQTREPQVQSHLASLYDQDINFAPTHTGQITQRQSNPFAYDSLNMPYWPDSNAASYTVPSIPPRNTAQMYAQIVGGGPYAQESQHPYALPHNTIQIAPAMQRVEVMSPGSPVEPSGFNANPRRGDTSRRPPPLQTFSRPALGIESSGFNANPRRGDASRRPPPLQLSSRLALGKKDENQKIGRVPPKLSPTVAYRMEFMPKTLTIPKIPKSLGGAKHSEHMITIVEVPSPLKPTVERTSILDRVLELRAKEQAKTLAKLKGDLRETRLADDDMVRDSSMARDLFKNTGESQWLQASKKNSKQEKQNAAELIPDVDSDEMNPSYAVAGPPPVPPKSALRSPVLDAKRKSIAATMHMAGDSDASDYSNDESVPSFENRSFQLMSAVPAGLNLGKTKAAEEPGKENKEEVGDAKKGAATTAGLKVPKSIATPSVESLATASSEEYEQIGTPTDMESDQNGVKTRWFKGFGNE